MSKHKSPPGTWLEREMFESKAYLSLRGFASQLLVLFLSKRRFENRGRKGKEKKICVNCNSLRFSYKQANEKYGITKSRFCRAIDELLAKGFITIVHQGGGFKQDQSIYALSDNWMLWQPGMVFESRKKESVQRGFCIPKTKVARETVPIHSHETVPIGGVLG